MKAKPLPPIDHIREILKYDPDTGVLTWRTNEKVSKNVRGKIAGCVDSGGYREIGIDKTLYSAHRLAWLISEGTDPGKFQVDHINGIRDDNRRKNLRLVTNAQNQHNQRSAKGDYFDSRNRKWKAQIALNSKRHHLGLYETEEEARAAYIEAKAKLHPTSPITK